MPSKQITLTNSTFVRLLCLDRSGKWQVLSNMAYGGAFWAAIPFLGIIASYLRDGFWYYGFARSVNGLSALFLLGCVVAFFEEFRLFSVFLTETGARFLTDGTTVTIRKSEILEVKIFPKVNGRFSYVEFCVSGNRNISPDKPFEMFMLKSPVQVGGLLTDCGIPVCIYPD